jgi:signal transduction histidine kinase
MPTREQQVDAVLERLRVRMMMRLFERFRFFQPAIAAIIGSTFLTIVFADGTPWRLALAAIATAAAIAGHFLGSRIAKRRFAGGTPQLSRIFYVPIVVLQSLVVFATGGLMSPLLVVSIAPTFSTALFEDAVAARTVLGVGLSLLTTYLIVQLTLFDLVPAPFHAAGGYPASMFVALYVITSTMHVVMFAVGRRTRSGYDKQLRQLAHAREHALTVFEDRTRELTTLSGELAHELKNPLASVKGLAQLVGRSLDGKSAERMGVMQREIDRMHAILEEFLAFSRPLAPLNLRTVPLRDLTDKVAELHEGMATQRHIEIAVEARGDTEVTCDPRKVQQILVNLIQNAIDASPDDGRIEMLVIDHGDEVIVDVLDAGAGIDAAIGPRIWEAGVTTKEHGTGLGLTVARAIARQHQGSLTLSDRSTRGCRARLVLPREGAVRSTEAASEPKPERERATEPAKAL